MRGRGVRESVEQLVDGATFRPERRVFRHSGDLRSGHAAGSETRAERGVGVGHSRVAFVWNGGAENCADRVKAQDGHRSAGPNAGRLCDSPNRNEVAQCLRHGQRDGVWVVAQCLQHVVELVEGVGGQIKEDPFLALHFASASAAAEPFVPQLVPRPLSQRNRFFQKVYRVHPSFSR